MGGTGDNGSVYHLAVDRDDALALALRLFRRFDDAHRLTQFFFLGHECLVYHADLARMDAGFAREAQADDLLRLAQEPLVVLKVGPDRIV